MITKKSSLFIIFIMALMLLVFALARAETIRLKNGRIFDAIVADDSGDEVKVVMKSGVVTFSKDEIYSIDGHILSPPPPVKKPVVKKPVKIAPVTPPPAPIKVQKTVTPVKKKVTQNKAVPPASIPAVALGTTTFTQFAPSTATADSAQLTPPNPLPAKSKKGASLNATADIIIVAIVLIAIVIVIITKRIKKQPKDTNRDITKDNLTK